MRSTLHRTSYPHGRIAALLLAALVLTSACGDDDAAGPDGTSTTTGTSETTTTTSATSTTSESTTTSGSTTTSESPGFAQPAVWPAADVVFTTPEAAAEDFVSEALGVPPVLGEFQGGDSRSGEIEVLFTGEGNGGLRLVRATLFLRQLGPDDGWFVLGAASDGATIESPEPGTTVPAGTLTVSGRGRGFEALVVVEAFIAGDAARPLDQVLAYGGSLETPEPFSAEVDLSGAAPGDMILLLVRGGVGLETDPGDFTAIPVQIEG